MPRPGLRRTVAGCVLLLPVSLASAAGPPSSCTGTSTLQELADLGTAHAQSGRFTEAESCFVLALRRSRGWRQHANLGSAYLDWSKALDGQKKPAEARHRAQQCVQEFEAALAASDGPPPALVHHLVAGAHMFLGQRAKTVAQLERLLRRKDASAADRKRAHELLDRITREPYADLDQAGSERHNKLFGEGSALVTPSMVLAGAPRRQPVAADVRKGIALLQQVVAADPRNWPALWIIGKGHEALGDHEASCKAFARAAAIHPYHPDVAREQCVALMYLGRGAEAVRVAERGVEWNPEDPGLLANLALAQLLAGDLSAAERNAAQALQADPDDQVTRDLVSIIAEVKSGQRRRPVSLPITANGTRNAITR